MEQQTELAKLKEIDEMPEPQKEPLLARFQAAHLTALDIITPVKDPRFYLCGVNIKPHPFLPGVMLTATNGHVVVFIYDETGYASREFILQTSKQLMACCKIKGLSDASSWVEVHDQQISVVKHGVYDGDDQMGLPGVEAPNVEFVNGVFKFEEIEGDFPDAARRVLPDLSEYNGIEDGAVFVQFDYLSMVKKAFKMALGAKEVYLRQLFKDRKSPIYIDTGLTDRVAAVVMPQTYDSREKALPEFLKVIKDDADESDNQARNEPAESNPYFDDDGRDVLYLEAVEFVREEKRPSISSIQRKFRIGYNRAAHIVEQMEVNGVVSKPGINRNREVLGSY